MSGLVELLSIGFQNLKSSYVEFATDGCEQKEEGEELGQNPIESGPGPSSCMKLHSSETKGRLVNFGYLLKLKRARSCWGRIILIEMMAYMA